MEIFKILKYLFKVFPLQSMLEYCNYIAPIIITSYWNWVSFFYRCNND